jgi:hypothetical protein
VWFSHKIIEKGVWEFFLHLLSKLLHRRNAFGSSTQELELELVDRITLQYFAACTLCARHVPTRKQCKTTKKNWKTGLGNFFVWSSKQGEELFGFNSSVLYCELKFVSATLSVDRCQRRRYDRYYRNVNVNDNSYLIREQHRGNYCERVLLYASVLSARQKCRGKYLSHHV